MENEEKRLIILNEETRTVAVFKDRFKASEAMSGTAETIRKRIAKGSHTLIYGKFRAYAYTKEKWSELIQNGYKDGSIEDACQGDDDDLFPGVFD